MYDILIKTMNVTRLLVSYRCPDGHGTPVSYIPAKPLLQCAPLLHYQWTWVQFHLYGFAAYAALRRLRLVAKGTWV